MSEETKRKSLETRLKRNNGQYASEETRQKISEGNKGKIVSEETRRKIMRSRSGYKHSEETRRKIMRSRIQRNTANYSLEHVKQKLSEVNQINFDNINEQKLRQQKHIRNYMKTIYRDKFRIYQKKYKQKRRFEPEFRIIENMRNRLKKALQQGSKCKKTMSYVGCSLIELKKHLENQFIDGMNWNNYGKDDDCWSIDHIVPCSSFDFAKEENIHKCFHYTNLQPLWHIDNIKKSNKIVSHKTYI